MPRIKKQHLKRRKDGRYCCVYHNIQFMGNTEEEALNAREEYKRAEAAGKLTPVYICDYANNWLLSYKSHLTAGPYNTHVRNINAFIKATGNAKITQITPTDITRFYQQYAGMSYSTITSVKDTIKSIFKAAYADGIIDRDPAAFISPPRGIKGSHREITPEERALIHATQHRLRPAVLVMLYAGLRRGEAAALQIERDVNFENNTITVREAVRYESNKPIIVRPKTQAGIRTVPMLQGLADELRPLSGLLCPSANGKLMTQAAFARAWESYLYALGVTKNGCDKRWSKGPWVPVKIRPHDLRHSFCTSLYDAGVDLKTAMLWMGHADQTMTLNIYTHLTETRRKEAVKAYENALNPAFDMQNDMQNKIEPSEPLKIKGL